jgi:hypothetical protein
LELGEALLLPGSVDFGEELVHFRVSARLTPHARHLNKYLSRRVPAGRSFVIRCAGSADGSEVRSLEELLALLSRAPDLGGHLRRRDFSRWIRDVLEDRILARRIRTLEERWEAGGLDQPCDALIGAVRERYGAIVSGPAAA